jgi:hypothetical protein
VVLPFVLGLVLPSGCAYVVSAALRRRLRTMCVCPGEKACKRTKIYAGMILQSSCIQEYSFPVAGRKTVRVVGSSGLKMQRGRSPPETNHVKRAVAILTTPEIKRGGRITRSCRSYVTLGRNAIGENSPGLGRKDSLRSRGSHS